MDSGQDGLGRYRMMRLLGEGAMGRVVLAVDESLGREVALKTIPPHLIEKGSILARFQREAQIQGSLEHPHVVRVYDCRLDVAQPFLVMEYVDGSDLDRILAAERRLSVDRVVRLIREIGSALDALHEAGVLHRDIKPSNIMVRRADGSHLLMDLGLAASQGATALTRTGQVLGTPRYFPPELMSGGDWSERADLFQLGAVAFQALTGEFLIPGKTFTEIMAASLAGRYTEFPSDLDVPVVLAEAIRRVTATDPEARFASGAEFGEAVLAALGESRDLAIPVLPPPVPPPPAGRTPSSRAWDRSAMFPALGETGSGFAPGGPGLGARLVASLATVIALLAMAWLLTGTREPLQVRWEVFGDAVRVSFEARRSQDLRLEVEGRPVEVEHIPDLEGEREALAFRGLPSEREVGVKLCWPGGESPVIRLQAQPPAVLPGVSLLPEGRLGIVADRPVEVWWAGGTGEPFELERGLNRVVPPAVGPPRLSWREGGIGFHAFGTWEDLFRADVEKLIDLSRGMGLPDTPRISHFSEFTATQGPEVVAAWERLSSWLPRILDSKLPVALRRELLRELERWIRGAQVLRYVSGEKAQIRIPEFRSGSRSWERPPWPAADSVEVDLVLPDGSRMPSNGVEIGSKVPDEAHRENRDLPRHLEFRWPSEVPSGATRLALLVEVWRLGQGTQLRFEAVEEPEPRFTAFAWHPRFRIPAMERFEGWMALVFPSDLAPESGSRVRVELETFFIENETKAGVRRVAVAWNRDP